MADTSGVGIILLHHENKVNPEDPLDRASGTSAMVAVPDTIWILVRRRAAGGSTGEEASLFVTGREVIEREIKLRWDPQIRGYNAIEDPTDEERI